MDELKEFIKTEINKIKASAILFKTIKTIEKMENALEYIDVCCYFAFIRKLYSNDSEIKNIDILKSLKILAETVSLLFIQMSFLPFSLGKSL